MYLACLFENILQSIVNTDYLLNTELSFTNENYQKLGFTCREGGKYNYYRVPLLNTTILKPLQPFY